MKEGWKDISIQFSPADFVISMALSKRSRRNFCGIFLPLESVITVTVKRTLRALLNQFFGVLRRYRMSVYIGKERRYNGHRERNHVKK